MMRVSLLFAALLLGATVAAAQPGPGGRPWGQLSPEERQRAWENYQRYRELPEQRQRSLEQRHRQFQALPPQEQQRLRQNYEIYRGFDPNQRQEFGQKYRRWKHGR